jgi:hypothetical protein
MIISRIIWRTDPEAWLRLALGEKLQGFLTPESGNFGAEGVDARQWRVGLEATG